MIAGGRVTQVRFCYLMKLQRSSRMSPVITDWMLPFYQVKYTKAMRDKADLTDTNERLEHIVMQLQGETDTIGEL